MGYSYAYMAKYVDTSFMTPYVYHDPSDTTHVDPPDTGDVRITLTDRGDAFVTYPNPFRERVNIRYSGTEPIEAAFITDAMGRSEEVQLTAEGEGRYSLDLSGRFQTTYLLTFVTASRKAHTVRLLKQSDITPGR